jgi:hypothetical protein
LPVRHDQSKYMETYQVSFDVETFDLRLNYST